MYFTSYTLPCIAYNNNYYRVVGKTYSELVYSILRGWQCLPETSHCVFRSCLGWGVLNVSCWLTADSCKGMLRWRIWLPRDTVFDVGTTAWKWKGRVWAELLILLVNASSAVIHLSWRKGIGRSRKRMLCILHKTHIGHLREQVDKEDLITLYL